MIPVGDMDMIDSIFRTSFQIVSCKIGSRAMPGTFSAMFLP